MSDSLRTAVEALRADLDRSYPRRAQYDIPSTVIDRLDAMLAAHPAEPATPVAAPERVAEVVLDELARIARGGYDETLARLVTAGSSRGAVVAALLAAGVLREPPTAEQIAMKLSLVRFSDEESDRMIELTMREAWPLADAVVDLLDGPR